MGQALCFETSWILRSQAVAEYRASRRFQGVRLTRLHHAGLSACLPESAALSAASKACTEAVKLLGRG